MRTGFILILAAGLLSAALPTAAQLRIVATTPSLGMLAREVAGQDHPVTVLTTPDQDVHHVQARPSFMAALRSADLLLTVGADLEAAWIEPAVNGAANPKLRPSRDGYFEAAAETTLIGVGGSADRRLGDVHPHGNPHMLLDPIRAGELAVALGQRLGQLDPAGSTGFAQRAIAVRVRLVAASKALQAKSPHGVSVVLYHADADYLMQRLGIPILGYVEPLPGIPPTARHIEKLADAISRAHGVIFHAPYHPATGPRRLAQAAGWRAVMLPIEPAVDASLDDYLALLERWVDALGGGS